MKWNKDNMGSTFMLEKKVESNPPFNPTQWAWWLVTVGVREMREVDGFYPHTSPILQLCLTFPPTG